MHATCIASNLPGADQIDARAVSGDLLVGECRRSIFGGTTEIQKEIIGRSLGL